jgi:hypothetical protein
MRRNRRSVRKRGGERRRKECESNEGRGQI